MKEFDINSIISIETMPKIYYQLEQIGSYIDKELAIIKDLECNEENKQQVKKVRTNINNMLGEFEEKRKTIKSQILNEYEQFNEKYELEVKDKLQNASIELKEKISQIENEQLKVKSEELREFVNQHIQRTHLENILDFSKVFLYGELKINLSTSLTSLKKTAVEFIEHVYNEIILINTEEFSDEVLLEYSSCFDYVQAKTIVLKRHKDLIEIAKKEDFADKVIEEENKIEQEICEILTPKEIIEDEELVECSFSVKCTIEQLKKIKNLLKELGVEYK